MPVRARVEERLVRKFVGGQRFSHGVVQSMPRADYRAVCEFAAEVYVSTVRGIDWNRALLEAGARCMALEHAHHEARVCPESIEVALLLLDSPLVAEEWREPPPPAPKEPIDFSMPKELRTMFAAWVRSRRKAVRATPLRAGEKRTW